MVYDTAVPASDSDDSPSPSTPLIPPASPTTPATPARPPALRHLLVSVLLFFTAIAMTIPVRPRLLLTAASDNAALASLFSGITDSLVALLSILSSPLLGAVSDLTGRRPILLLSHLGELIGLLLVARFPRSLAAQLPAYLLIALTNAYVTTANTIVADLAVTHPSHPSPAAPASSPTAHYGFLGAAIGFTFLVGPALGGYIEAHAYLAASFHVAAVLIVLALVYVFVFLPETKPPTPLDHPVHHSPHIPAPSPDTSPSHPGAARALRNLSASAARIWAAVRATDVNPFPRVAAIFLSSEALTWVAAALALGSLAQGGLNAIMFLYVHEKLGWETGETGIYLSGVGASLLIAQGVLAPALVMWLGETRTILFGYVMSALHYYAYARARSSVGMALALGIGMFSFVADPAMKGMLARQVGSDKQGALQGSVSALNAVVRPVAPLLSTALFSYGTSIGRPGLVFEAIAGVSATSVMCVWVAFWKPGLK